MIGGMSIVLGVLAVLWVASGFYVVDAREESVVLRFGRYVETTGSGLHWRMPWPIEQNEKKRLRGPTRDGPMRVTWCWSQQSLPMTTPSPITQ